MPTSLAVLLRRLASIVAEYPALLVLAVLVFASAFGFGVGVLVAVVR